MKRKERWSRCVVGDTRYDASLDFSIRHISDITTEAKVIVDDLLFQCVDIFRCFEGRFEFTFRDHEPVTLEAGSILVLYPGRYVTIRALEKTNRFVGGSFEGSGVEAYFDGLGFFDFATGKTAGHLSSINGLRKMMEDGTLTNQDSRLWRSQLTDILSSQVAELRESYHPLVFEALSGIAENLRTGIVRIAPLCEKLKISRVYLNRIFANAGLGSPSEVIRSYQLRRAVQLLVDTDSEIAEVARLSGFISAAHFSTFIREKTGSTPSIIRRRGR